MYCRSFNILRVERTYEMHIQDIVCQCYINELFRTKWRESKPPTESPMPLTDASDAFWSSPILSTDHVKRPCLASDKIRTWSTVSSATKIQSNKKDILVSANSMCRDRRIIWLLKSKSTTSPYWEVVHNTSLHPKKMGTQALQFLVIGYWNYL